VPFQHPHRVFKREKGSEKEKTVPEPAASTKISSKRPQKKLNTGIQLLSATPVFHRKRWNDKHPTFLRGRPATTAKLKDIHP
jgi:hypothetical protein